MKNILLVIASLFLVSVGLTNKIDILAENNNSKNEYETKTEDSETGNDFFQFNYSNGWNVSTGYDQFSNGDEHWTNSSNWGNKLPFFEFKFIGNNIELYGNKQDVLGIYNVIIDEKKVGEIDAYSPVTRYQELLGSYDVEEGEHTLRLEMTQSKNPQSKRHDGQIDFIKVRHNEIPATSLSITQEDIIMFEKDTKLLDTKVSPSYSTNQEIIWSVDNEDLVEITQEGKVTALKKGKVNITARIKNTNIEAKTAILIKEELNGFNAFVGSTDRHYLQKDYQDIKFNGNTSWHDVGWKNDRLSSEVVITTYNNDIENIDATITDFINNNDSIFDSNNISIRKLKETKAYVGRGFNQFNNPMGPKDIIPDIIHQELPVNVNKERVQPLWVTIDIPKDTDPGIYEGEIILLADNSESIALDYSFEVLDIVLPDQDTSKNSDFSMELWQYPYTAARYYDIPDEELFKTEHLKILTEQLKMYKKVGGDSITVTIVEDAWNHQTYDEYPSMIKWVKKLDGSFEYDYTHMDAYVNLALSLGIDKQIKSFSMVPWENRIIYYDEAKGEEVTKFLKPGSDEWIAIWDSFLESYVDHLDEKGWFDITYIAMDERSLADMEAVINIVHQHKNKDGKHLKISGAMNYNAVSDRILDEIDDISISFEEIDHQSDEVRELTEHRRELGFTTTMYTMTGQYPNSFSRNYPSESAWVMWYAESQKLDGYLRWAFDAWVEDPLEDITHWWWESGDPFFIYPNEKNSGNIKPYSSPRYERMSEATRDIRKVRYLKSIDPSLEEQLDELTQSIGRRYGKTNVYGAMQSQSKEDSQFISAEVSRMREGVHQITSDYLAKIKTDQEKADRVKDLIASLPKISDIILEDREAVEAARAAYGELPEESKTLVTNIGKLEKIEYQITNLEKATAIVEKAETTKSAEDIAAAQELVTALVDSVEKTALQDRLDAIEVEGPEETEEEAKRAAGLVSRMIYRLPNVRVLTVEDAGLVEAARAAYEDLSDQAKDYVTTLGNLELRENRLIALSTEDEEVVDQFAVLALQRRIYRLPSARVLTVEDAPQVEGIRADYEALNAASKATFSPQYLKNLELREAKLEELEKRLASSELNH